MSKEYQDLEPARVKREPVAHLWNKPNWIAEEKLDGWKIQLHIGNPCRRLYAVTRGGEEVGENVRHLFPNTDISRLGYTVLDGELLPENGQEFHSLASVRAGLNERVAYKAFDVLFINGTDVRALPLRKRLELLNAILSQVFCNHSFVLPVRRALTDTYQFLLQLLAAGIEGVVLKDLDATYGNGCIKAKRVSTFDVIITGFRPGYDLKHGAVIMSVCDGINLREVGKCGIANQQVRLAMDKDPNSFLGKVIEVKALRIDPSNGVLREPRFCSLRPDMSPLDATWDKLQRDMTKIELE